MQGMRSRTDTRYFERPQPQLRVLRQTKVSNVSPVSGPASLYRRQRYNLQRMRQEINSAQRFIRLQGPARHSGTTRYRRRPRPEFGILHPLQCRRNPTHSSGCRRHTQVSYLLSEFIFTFEESGTWVTFRKINFHLKRRIYFNVSRTIRWYVTVEIGFIKYSRRRADYSHIPYKS